MSRRKDLPANLPAARRGGMREVTALRIRNHLGAVLDELERDGEPILISKGRKPAAVLITPEQFQRRFLDYQAEADKRRVLDRILGMRAGRILARPSLAVLRELRGYDE